MRDYIVHNPSHRDSALEACLKIHRDGIILVVILILILKKSAKN
jgi:hypothetical protein